MSQFDTTKFENNKQFFQKTDKQSQASLSQFNPQVGENEETADKTKTLNPNLAINLAALGNNEVMSSPNSNCLQGQINNATLNKIQLQAMSKDELKTNDILTWKYSKLHQKTRKMLEEYKITMTNKLNCQRGKYYDYRKQ